MSPTPPDEASTELQGASRRTRLAGERTYLAWLRSALTALAIGIGVAKLLPDIQTTGSTWPDSVLGIGFCALGILFAGYGLRRYLAVARALREGEFAPLQDRMVWVFGLAAIALGLVTTVVIIAQS